MLSGISMYQPIDTNLDACAPHTVTKRVDPIAVHLGRFDEHAPIVAQRLHRSSDRNNALARRRRRKASIPLRPVKTCLDLSLTLRLAASEGVLLAPSSEAH
jgi:hypothetical protein